MSATKNYKAYKDAAYNLEPLKIYLFWIN